MNLGLIALLAWISGVFVAWGLRGMLEREKNKDVKGYKSVYE